MMLLVLSERSGRKLQAKISDSFVFSSLPLIDLEPTLEYFAPFSHMKHLSTHQTVHIRSVLKLPSQIRQALAQDVTRPACEEDTDLVSLKDGLVSDSNAPIFGPKEDSVGPDSSNVVANPDCFYEILLVV